MRRSLQHLAVLLATSVAAAPGTPLFDTDALLQLEIAGPLDALLTARAERRALPFVVRIDGVEVPAQIRARGNSRLRICAFPPLRIELAPGAAEGTALAGQSALRLVTHCGEAGSARLDVLDEYAAYRIFNLLSDVGYRVRLLQITYAESDPRHDDGPRARYAFVVEPARELARRVGGARARVPGVALGALDERQAALVYVFQYLIGNTDWSLVTADGDRFCCHNVDLFQIGSELYVTPFDFDLSGLVNARYAKPDPSLRISKVTQRQYRGYCVGSDALTAAVRTVGERRAEILGVLDGIPGLPEKTARRNQRFLDRFLRRAAEPARLVADFARDCL